MESNKNSSTWVSKPPTSLFTHILVPIDFGASSIRALDLAIEIALTFAAELTLLHVHEIPFYPYAGGAPVSIGELIPAEEVTKVRLEETVRRVAQRHPMVKSQLRTGVPWQRIVEAIKEPGIDLVVMGTHGHRGLSHLLLGSVAEKVVRISPVPVMTVRDKIGHDSVPYRTEEVSR